MQKTKPRSFVQPWWLGIITLFLVPTALLAVFSYTTFTQFAAKAVMNPGAASNELDQLQFFIKTIYTLILLATLAVSVVMIYLISRLRESKDVTQRQAARHEALFASIGEGLLVVNEYGNIVEANPAALDLLGYQWEDLKDKWFPRAVKNVDDQGQEIAASERPILKTLETGKPVATRANYITKRGTTLPVFVTVAPFLVDNQPVGAINIFQDRSEEMKIERTKDEFVSLASHQLRTPLTSIRLFTEMLIDEQVGKLGPKQKDYLEKVELSTERMIKLVADILNVSRLELGRLKIEPVPTDMLALVQTHIEEVTPVAQEKGIVIDFEPPAGDWTQIPLDPTLMGQVIHNLLSNALHYTPNHKGKVEVILKQDDEGYTLAVTDNGIGIPPEAKSRIFERFFRAENAIAVEGEGTGLGLYLIKMIMNAAGGSVSFKSRPHHGTTFYASLPKTGMKPRRGEKSLND